MTLKTVRVGPFALLGMWLPLAAKAQTISSSPPIVANVPVDNPLALGALLGLVAMAGWWSLRRNHGARRVMSLLVVAAFAGLVGYGSGLMAQVVNAFTNPSGETLPIAISPITAGGFTGFQPADFSNGSGVALRISAINPPDFAQCFANNPANTLMPPGAPTPSPYPACDVGTMLANGAICRVNVEAICRALYVSGATLTAIAPSQGTASGGLGVTLTGSGLTGATGVTLDGIPATSINVINSTTLTAVTPAHAAGAVNVVVITPGGAAQLSNGFTYLSTAVGQPSGGGVIAVLNGGLNNLIAAAADNSAGLAWGGVGTAVGSSSQSNTDGALNTAATTATLGSNGGTPYAAQLCSTYEVDSQGNTPCQAGNACYNDWFLPARNQLAALYANKAAVGGFALSPYWTSTEDMLTPTNTAWIHDFSSGIAFTLNKTIANRTRCVRAFTP